MLDSHPELAIPPETTFFSLDMNQVGARKTDVAAFFDAIVHFPAEAPAWRDFHLPKQLFWSELRKLDPFTLSDGYRVFYRLYAERFGKSLWGDKAPLHTLFMDRIERILPEAHFIHIIRDGRDVCLSLRKMWFSPGWDAETQARHWCHFVSMGRNSGARSARYLEVRYEDLIAQTETVLRNICTFLQLRYSDEMLRYYTRTPDRLREHEARFSIDGSITVSKEQRLRQQERTMRPPDIDRAFAWRASMDHDERLRYDAVAAPLLAQLGYDVEPWRPAGE
jgi:hypothetical protein